jgi:ribosomal protein S18 acetylase RimI-like enzyme
MTSFFSSVTISPMLKIRAYLKGDEPEIVEVIKTVLEEIFQSEAYGLEDLDEINHNYIEKNGVFLVAEDDGKIVGTIASHESGDGSAYMKRWYVYKEYRHKGIGRALYEQIMDQIKQKGYEKVRLTTSPLMKDAIEFYKRNNYLLSSQDDLLHFEKSVT